MPNNRPISARDNGFTQIQYIKGDLSWNTPGITTGVKIGTLPQNAELLPGKWKVVVAFDGTTPILVIGTTQANANEILAAGDIAEGTPGAGVANTGLNINTATGPVDIWAKLTAAGATQGRAVIILPYAGAAG